MVEMQGRGLPPEDQARILCFKQGESPSLINREFSARVRSIFLRE